jgi:hypothetical protein
MSDEPVRIKFESLLKDCDWFCIDKIASNNQELYNLQDVGKSIVYNKNSSDAFRTMMFLSSYQPGILFIKIATSKSLLKYTIQNPNYDFASGRSSSKAFNLAYTFIRRIPSDWDKSLLQSDDPMGVFNNGIKTPLPYE